MGKIVVTKYSGDYDCFDISVKRLTEILQQVSNDYGDDAIVNMSEDSFYVDYRRTETDSEFDTRMNQEERQKQARLAQYQKLKAEFGEAV